MCGLKRKIGDVFDLFRLANLGQNDKRPSEKPNSHNSDPFSGIP